MGESTPSLRLRYATPDDALPEAAHCKPFGLARMLVVTRGDDLIGWAKSAVRPVTDPRTGTPPDQNSIETTAWVDPTWRRQGVGSRLYAALFRELRFQPRLIAWTTSDAVSTAFHASLGFQCPAADVSAANSAGGNICALSLPNRELPCLSRSATPSDQDRIKETVFAVLREYGLPVEPGPGGADADLSAIDESYFRQGGHFEVVCHPRGSIIGSWGLSPRGEACELRKMYLAAPGRGLGIGAIMLESALARAWGMGFRTVSLETASVMKEAVGLYEKYGFRPTGTPPHVGRCDLSYILRL